MKWLLSLLVLVLGYAFWKSRRADAAEERAQKVKGAPPSDRVKAKGAAPAQAMLACAHCGVHVPQADSVAQNGQNFCSSAHAQLNRAD